MTKKELLAIPRREWSEKLSGVCGVYVLPNRRKHESGWMCMDFVAEMNNGRSMIRFGGACDDISFRGDGFAMDCSYPSGIIHIWNRHYTFAVSVDLSSIDFVEEYKI